LLYGVASLLKLPPDAVRAMAYEDVIGLVAYARKEADELEKRSANPSDSGLASSSQKSTRRLRKR